MATYVGPTVGPVFVTGLINDSWAQVVERTNAARKVTYGLQPEPIQGDVPKPLEAPEDFDGELATAPQQGNQTADSIAGQLDDLLTSFIDRHYPSIAMPNGAAAWERVVSGFTGDALSQAASRVRARTDLVWSARGFSMPTESREFQRREVQRREVTALDGASRNADVIRKTHRKGVDLTGYEIVMRTQLDALDAARAYLLGGVLALYDKAADDQMMLIRLKDGMQSAFMRHLSAQIEAGTNTLEQIALERRIELDATLSEEDRKVFIFRQTVQAALDELQSIASQASAAINRVSASATVGGSERTP